MLRKISWITFLLLITSLVFRKFGIAGGSLLLNLSSFGVCLFLLYGSIKTHGFYPSLFLSVFLILAVAFLQYWMPLSPFSTIESILWLILSFWLFKRFNANLFLLSIWSLTGAIILSALIFNAREFHNFYRANTYEEFIQSKYTEPQGIVADLFIDKFKKTDKINSEKYFLKGKVADSLGDYESALKYYNKSIDMNPDNPVVYHRRGFLKLTHFDLNMDVAESAAKDFSKAIRLDPAFTMAYFHRALAAGYLGNKGRSLLDMKKVWEADSILSDEQFLKRYGISKKSFSIPFHP